MRIHCVWLFERLRLAEGEVGRASEKGLESLGERQEEGHGWQVLPRVPSYTEDEAPESPASPTLQAPPSLTL